MVNPRTLVGAASMALLVLSAHVVPYAWLSGVRAWYGSFLFWTLFAVVSIAVVGWVTAPWSHPGSGGTRRSAVAGERRERA
ncbi:hypothetical protein [Geochorda subterranea]|uniref:Uncharacterized protein n=1 Tax=Geochorda subterranea TaxID=3109564 RepID=A0ABZ1BS48_9FIRM|nr:hypothetical protein [Limnochorda sp. LNt]WRP15007.1 hypothetical protein VLY81_02195 [Limnochorda sp. LNt]